jgi:hypothetical protein
MTKAPKAGWYPSPENPGREQRWDGAAWTDETRLPAPVTEADANRKKYALLPPLLILILVIGLVVYVNAHKGG